MADNRAPPQVGNKVDLERSRHVSSEEGKELAHCYDAKFIETSAGIEHNVDELLVGVLKQILLREETEHNPLPVKVTSAHLTLASPLTVLLQDQRGRGASCSSLVTLRMARQILLKICSDKKSTSCENLHVL